MSKPAFVKWYSARGQQTARATLRGGAKGSGKVLQSVSYWPNSSASMEAADKIFAEVAAREGYTIVGSDRDEE